MPGQKDPGPSVKDDEQCETAGKRGGQSPPYEDWTKDDLYERAQEIDIDGRSDMSKDELIDALRNH